MGHNVIAFKQKKGEISLEANDTTARFKAVGRTKRISVEIKARQVLHLFTFLQYEVYRWYWEQRLLLLLLLLFFNEPTVISLINAFISMPHQFSFFTRDCTKQSN